MEKGANRVKAATRAGRSATILKKRGGNGSSRKRGGDGESKVCSRFHHAVELIGRRWSGAIISVMLGGPQCFNEMLAAVPGLSDRLLTERLRELESEGLVRRTVLPGPPVRVSYELTEAGKSLEPVIESLGRWAERWVKV
jgi:DNA-binding HxlR family transcriptional regulator